MALCFSAVTLFEEGGVLDLLALDKGGIAGCGNNDLAQHLANDHLDVLVIDLHALQSVNLLDLVDDVLGQGRNTLEAQDVMGTQGTLGHHFTLLHLLTLEDRQLTPLGNQHFVVIGTIRQQ